jgi:hypothetical protein
VEFDLSLANGLELRLAAFNRGTGFLGTIDRWQYGLQAMFNILRRRKSQDVNLFFC